MTKLEKIYELLSGMKIRQAVASLRMWAKALGEHDIALELDSISDTYSYLVRFFLQGVADPERENMVADLERRLAMIALQLTRCEEKRDNPGLYYNALRNASFARRTLPPLLEEFHSKHAYSMLVGEYAYDENAHRDMEQALADIFTLLWVSFPLSKSDLALVSQTLVNPSEPLALTSQMVSALMLGSMKYFDPAVMRLFVEAYVAGSTPEPVKARLLVAIVLLHMVHSGSLPSLLLESGANNDLLQMMPEFNSHLKSVANAIVSTCETREIADKMRNEILPAFAKIQPDIMKRFKDIARDADLTDPEMLDPEMNPEWADLMEKTGLQDKLRDLAESQARGADVMMPAFSNLKQFPFFNSIDAWFLPFDPYHSQLCVVRSIMGTPAGEMLTRSEVMCDSDRYSFALALERIPEAQKQMMVSQMQAQYEQMQEDLETEVHRPSDFSTEAVNYVRDLYRFFTLFRLSREFSNPFDRASDLLGSMLMRTSLGDDRDFLMQVGDELLRLRLFPAALAVLRPVVPQPGLDLTDTDRRILEKYAYCLQMSGDLEGAYTHYEMAGMAGTKSQWLTRKLALVSRLLGNYAVSVGHYREALEREPENISLLMNLGHSLMGAKRYDEALGVYYQVNYLRKENMNALRAIAWCRVMLKDFKKARGVYEEILTSDPSGSDYLNMGHLALVEGKFGEAQAMYVQNIRSLEGGFKEFEKLFREDYDVLTKELGVKPFDIDLLMDSLSQGS